MLTLIETLIDHISTNSIEKIKQFGVLDVSLSGHQAIYCTRKVLKQKFSTHLGATGD